MEEIERNTLIIGSPGCLDGSRTGQDRLSLAVYWQQRAARAPLGHPLLQGARLPPDRFEVKDSKGRGKPSLRTGGFPQPPEPGNSRPAAFRGPRGSPSCELFSQKSPSLWRLGCGGSTEFSVAERVSPSPRAPAAYFRSLAPCPPAVAIATTCRGGMGEFGVPEADKRQDSAGRASPSPWPWLPPRLAAAELCLPSLCRFPSQGFTSPREGEFSDLLSSPNGLNSCSSPQCFRNFSWTLHMTNEQTPSIVALKPLRTCQDAVLAVAESELAVYFCSPQAGQS
ncbi:uncharacterized protein LOC116420285 [Sarcophilus harrisii]|uniref:uncharacterized protein LOC116420285 n=1 Tax=Sarcophilus harrisii TaxID=9305 RepID=UPI001301EF8A|nr:uncharacterized protein LOC116420285 [Sarcophilus harrisii]